MPLNAKIDGKFCLWTGMGLTVFLAVSLLLPSLCFWFQVPLGAWMFWCAVLVGAALAWRRGGVFSAAGMGLIIAASALLCSLLFDTSYDSLHYHQWTVQYLREGWNPLLGAAPTDNIWVQHYARGQELLSAVAASALGLLNAGRCVNLIFTVATLLLSVALVGDIAPQLGRRKVWILSLVWVLNPVAAAQAISGYNDSFVYLELLLMALSFILLAKQRRRIVPVWALWTIAATMTVFAVNSKFTHFFFAGLAWMCFFVYLGFRRKATLFRHAFGICFASGLIGVFLVGFNPYVTNFMATGDPLYPLLSGKVDIMTDNTPEMLQHCNRFTAFLTANLSTPESDWQLLRNPFKLSTFSSTTVDSRILGFGPFFIPLLLLSLFVMWRCRATKGLWVLAALAFVPGFVFAQVWWARYVPMMWAVIGIGVYASYLSGRCVVLRRVIVGLCFLTAAMTAVRTAAPQAMGMYHLLRIKSDAVTVEKYIHDTPIMEYHFRDMN